MRRRRRVPHWEHHDSLLDSRPTLELDLHGFSAPEAIAHVRNFVASASRTNSGRVIHIITGKGRGSTKGPVLRPAVKRLLEGELRAHVSDYSLDLEAAGYLVRLR